MRSLSAGITGYFGPEYAGTVLSRVESAGHSPIPLRDRSLLSMTSIGDRTQPRRVIECEGEIRTATLVAMPLN
jgi:hypothetical protein